jgi:hypothetical protein
VIPQRLVRVVPEHTSVEVENWWSQATALHPDWQHVTLRDPIDPKQFPLTSEYWIRCESGGQLADLVRAEYLVTKGGIYLDSDYQVFKSLEPLRRVDNGFAGWEDSKVICNAMMGFPPGHFGLLVYLQLALTRLDQGTWASGVGTFTEVMKDRGDVLLLPPESLYPVHYRDKDMIDVFMDLKDGIQNPWPWSFGVHHWRHSWGTDGVAANR